MTKLPGLYFQFGISTKGGIPKTANHIPLRDDVAKIADMYDELFNLALTEHASNDSKLLERLHDASQYTRRLTTTKRNTERLRQW